MSRFKKKFHCKRKTETIKLLEEEAAGEQPPNLTKKAEFSEARYAQKLQLFKSLMRNMKPLIDMVKKNNINFTQLRCTVF